MEINRTDYQLSMGEIVDINSLGPFNHSIWRGRGVTVTHEEKLTGRVQFLARIVRDAIKKRFRKEDLEEFTIFNIGCFDGWLLESLSDIPFKQLIGFEPRRENIEKGLKIREILRIPSRVNYVEAEIDGINDQKCGILICFGVLHHMPSVFEAVRRITQTRPKLIILISITTPSYFISDGLLHFSELKDVVYRQARTTPGLSAFKYETKVYPGSAADNTVFEIPTKETIEMAFNVHGYSNVSYPISSEHYRAAMPASDSPFHASIVVAERGPSVFDTDPHFQEKADFICTVLPIRASR